MNRQIGRLAAVVLVLFGALFVNLNVITLLQADELVDHPANRRVLIREFSLPRGPIVVDEVAVARSVETEGEYRYRRTYPEGELYAHLTGYYSLLLHRSGLEAALNEVLTGRSSEVVAQNLGELLGARDEQGNTVRLTIEPQVQQAARNALEGRIGAVVAIRPTTGAVLAHYSSPSYDPDRLAGHETAEIREAWEVLLADPDRPLVDRATAATYPPGSGFKLITAAAALEAGIQPDRTFPDEVEYDVPQTSADIGNFSDGVCLDGDEIDLVDALRVSCNTTFARLGVELGADTLVEQARRFGFGHAPPYELDVASSEIPAEMDVPATAQSAIGQRDVRATPMQMALVAAAIANDGQLMRPHVVAAVHDAAGRELRGADVGRWTQPPAEGQPISPRTARQLEEMMVAVVESGTGSAAAIAGERIGGKTGTAQTGQDPVAWFVGFAGDEVALAVAVAEAGPDATGGAVAAPVAREVFAAALADG